MDRRKFIRWTALSSFASVLLKSGWSEAEEIKSAPANHQSAEAEHLDAMQHYAELTAGPKAVIGMLVYPGMFLQDLVGPLTVFESLMNREIHLLWKDLDPVKQDTPGHPTLIPVTPTTTFEQCPEHLDVLFVPGGVPGTFNMMEDETVLKFLAGKGKAARFVTSVCTGSLILGAAGLLDGYKATSYWSMREVLKELGAIPTQGRIVIDRSRITGGGVTAGIDFGLKIAALLTSETYAQAIQLYLEYDPQPPFDAGSPEKAPPLARQFLSDMFAGMVQTAIVTARRAKARLAK
jgi:cyclohexyl-isocyanide hydratase